MNSEDAQRWCNSLLNEIFEALSASQPLQEYLIYKGARILNERLKKPLRQSLDIDCNLSFECVSKNPSIPEQQRLLEKEIPKAVEDFFKNQDPVRYKANRVKIVSKGPHVYGWDAFEISISIHDYSKPGIRGLPSIRIDVAAVEELSQNSTAPLTVGNHTVWAYTLERIAGEKMRAFLSSLPSYRKKVKKPGDAVRVKDIYDLACIYNDYPISESGFWEKTGREFEIACKSRFVDCFGVETFEEDLNTTRDAYSKETIIPKNIPFEVAWSRLQLVISYMEGIKIIPFAFPVE